MRRLTGSIGIACLAFSAAASATQDLGYPVAGGTIKAHVDHGPHGENPISDYQCGQTTYEGHDGTDFAVLGGSRVNAAAGGWVVRSEQGHPNNDSLDLPEGFLIGDLPAGCGGESYSDAPGGGFGNHVAVLHPNGTLTLYAHLQGAQLAWGSPVACGDGVANVGLSGCTSGYHLHFEVRSGVSASGAGFCSNTRIPSGSTVDPFAGSCNQDPPAQMTACAAATEEELATLGAMCGEWSADQLRYLNETLDDGTVLDPAETPDVPKTWTVQNVGTTTWDPAAGYELRFVGNGEGCDRGGPDLLSENDVIELAGPILPGESVTLELMLSVPEEERSYRGGWRMFNGQEYFGSCLWFDFSVGGEEASPGCYSGSLKTTVREGDYVRATSQCGTCAWHRCSSGSWMCEEDASDVPAWRTAYDTCGQTEVDPPPPSGKKVSTYPELEKAVKPVVSKLGCMSKTAGAVESGECVQVSYSACGAAACGWRRCEDGEWVCTSGPEGCSVAHSNDACSSCESCDHGECETGPALAQGSSACTSAVCATLPECCAASGAWDEACVTAAENIHGACRGVCYDGVSSCSHSECEAGVALSPSCSTCAASVCDRDPFCCEKEWDSICARISAKRDPYCSCEG